ncbi:MAG TPA: helix-turn-helix domain-containing protein [Chitinophagaceae bacterium]|nr:helix-turn-helix domain-containing protein [Chitinophagaceae bacterium]
MNRKLTEVKETAEQLREKLKSEVHPLVWQRLQALYLIASSQVKHRTQIAKILGVNRNSVSSWLKIYESGGLEELLKLKKAKGKPPTMTFKAKTALAEKLAAEKGFGSYGEIRTYLLEKHEVELSYSRVHTIVRYEMGAKPKVPRPSNPNKKKS